MLNDMAWRTRISVFLQALGPGVVLGWMASGAEVSPAGVGALGIGVLLLFAWLLWAIAGAHRIERRVWNEVVAGSEEILAGTAPAVSVPGRVVRFRVQPRLPHFGLAVGRREAPSVAMAVTVVGDGPPRRVGVLAPALSGLQARDAPLVVALHPERREVGVLDDRISRQDLDAAARDPRWAQPLPTDRSISGGWAPALAWGAAGLLAGGLGALAALRTLS